MPSSLSPDPRQRLQVEVTLEAGTAVAARFGLAALALEHRRSVVSYDNVFSRFQGVRWMEPPV